jgi:hypothetical protein
MFLCGPARLLLAADFCEDFPSSEPLARTGSVDGRRSTERPAGVEPEIAHGAITGQTTAAVLA